MFTFHPPSRFAFRTEIRKAALTPMERLIDQLAPAMQKAIRQAMQTAQGRIDLDVLAALIEQGRISRAVLELGIDRFTSDDLSAATDLLGKALAAGAALAHAEIKGGFAFNVTNLKARRAAEVQAAELLTAVNEETKQTVRDLIVRAYRDSLTADDTARLIRDVVGLNNRQATALFNYRQGLIEDGMSPEQVASMAAKYATRLLRDRARMIAQTEIHRASADGQHELWREAVRAGRLNPTTARRIWITNVGACPWCEGVADLNSDGVPIDGQFETPDGDLIDGPEDSHPSCRCSSGLDFGVEE